MNNESHENPTLISNLSMDGENEHDSGRGWEVVAPAPAGRPSSVSAATYGDEFSVFPPSLHEGLAPNLTLDPPSSSAEGLEENSKEEEAAAEAECHVSRTRIAESARRLAELGVELIRSKIAGLRGGGGGCGSGGAVWSFAAVAGFAGVLMYMRRRHRRERELLLFLILDKDERINQLMDQIVRMSEVIATNYKVPAVTRT